MEEAKRKSVELLNALTNEDFEHCFEQWKKQMESCYLIPRPRNTRGKNNLHTIPHSTSLYSESFIHTGLQLYNTLPGYLKEMPPSKFKSQLQHKNSFYSVKEFNEYFQNKDEAKPTTEICLHV